MKLPFFKHLFFKDPVLRFLVWDGKMPEILLRKISARMEYFSQSLIISVVDWLYYDYTVLYTFTVARMKTHCIIFLLKRQPFENINFHILMPRYTLGVKSNLQAK